MNYEQTIKKTLTIEWRVGTCNSGEDCWCRTIFPKEDLIDDNGEEVYIVGYGSISKEFAEHIVELHNKSLAIKDNFEGYTEDTKTDHYCCERNGCTQQSYRLL
jgi:hypothetical protein